MGSLFLREANGYTGKNFILLSMVIAICIEPYSRVIEEEIQNIVIYAKIVYICERSYIGWEPTAFGIYRDIVLTICPVANRDVLGG